MSQALANTDAVPLFACTKCNSRHPFEDLSQGHQLCRDCKGSFQVVKCNYCRNEFQQDGASKSASSICKKCEQLQEQHGKPGPCAYCNIIAAFIGTKCQRCTNSEKKYGSPLSCEHCRQKCAFDRKDPESKKKVDGKILCWLCTMAYKRTLAKARQKEATLKTSSTFPSSHHRPSGSAKPYSSSSSRHLHHQTSGSSSTNNNSITNNGHRNPNSGASGTIMNASSSSSPSTLHRSSHRHSHHNSRQSSKKEVSASISKKQRLDLSSSSNGHLSSNLPSLSETRFNDPNSGDLAAVVTQLKEQVTQLNKKIQVKERELLSKDQQIADLKSTSAREQRELREKISTLQKQHSERMSDYQNKLVTMQKQIASHAKGNKTSNPNSAYAEPPLVI